MSKIEKTKNAEVKITASVEKEEWAKAQKDAFKKLARKIEVKGFRKGQAPDAVVRQHISDQQVQFEAMQNIAQDLLAKAVAEHDVELIDRPSLDIDTINGEECTLIFICPVKPDVELGQYTSLGYEVKKVTVKASEVEDELKKIQEKKAELVLKEDGEVEDGDTAVIDFEGFKDGVAFDGGKGENYDLVIGSKSFVPGFEDQLIGMKAEEEKDINITFPKDYQAEDLKGKDVVFKVKVHEIKKKVLPEIDEAIIEELKIEGVKTLDELKKHIKETLKKNKETEAENKATEELVEKISDNAKVEIPAIMIEEEAKNMFNDYKQRMLYQGIDMQTYFKITGSSEEQLIDSMKQDAEKRVKTTLVLEAIAKKENLEVSDKDIEEEFNEMSKQYGMPVEEIKKYVPETSLKADLKVKKAIEFAKKN